MHPDYEKEQIEQAKQWAADTKPGNEAALRRMRALVPPDIRTASLADLEGKGLPKGLCKRLWTKKVGQLPGSQRNHSMRASL